MHPNLRGKKSQLLNKMSLIDVANEFISLHPSRLNAFGKFTGKDAFSVFLEEGVFISAVQIWIISVRKNSFLNLKY